jgi:flagellar M-ring protein FliF
MRENLTRTLARYRRAFGEFTVGQKAVVIVGTGALLLAAFLVFRWVSTPSYAPLYANLQGSDASAVIDELNKEGVQYKLTDGGSTIEVPQNAVYSTRINLAGQGLPAQGGATPGYSLLDGESLSTSDFQEQTDFKRAMEGELDNTLEAMNGVQTAVVHLAMPQKQVFSDQQDPTTASVLLGLDPGTTLSDEQVQAIVHLVSSSIDGLDAKNVTVTDSQGNLLTAPESDVSGLTSTQSDAQQAFEAQQTAKVQALLDRIVGPGNATAQVTADLNFDQQTTQSTTYGTGTPVAGSESKTDETYKGPGAAGAASSSGVVGPDGQMGTTTTTGGAGDVYTNRSDTTDNKVDQTDQTTVAAPGGIKDEHIMVALDSNAIGTVQPGQIGKMIKAGMGINTKRGDSLVVNSFPFNRSAEQAAQNELNAAAAAQAKAQRNKLYRNIGIGAIVAIMLLLAWLTARRRSKARAEATSYVVEQLRADAVARAAQVEAISTPALAALESAEEQRSDTLRVELNKLVDDQPEDVAALLRGWLVERPR